MNVFLWNARARNGHVEATLNHPFPAQVDGTVVATTVGDSPVALRSERKSWRSPAHDAESGRAAVEAAGGFVRDGRVWADAAGPGLAMARSLGDVQAKGRAGKG